MESAFERNIEAIRRHCPYIEIDKLVSEPDNDKFIVEACKNGEQTIKAKNAEGYIYIHSKYDPMREANQFAIKFKQKPDDVIVISGFGFGYHVKSMIRQCSEKNRIIIFEPDYEILKHAIRAVDLTDVFSNEKIYIIIDKTPEDVDVLCRRYFSYEYIMNTTAIVLPPYMTLYKNQLEEFKKILFDVGKFQKIMRNTYNVTGDLWNENFFRNMKFMVESYSIHDWYLLFEDKPVVLVSAGPSLNKNLELLREIKGKVLIVCVYTALKVLEKANIRPDIIIALDASQTAFENENYVFDIPFIYLNTIESKLLDIHKGNKMVAFASLDNYIIDVLKKLGKHIDPINCGESVACAALDIITKFGADPVIFIGQDLAYTNNKNHADGTFYDGNNTLDFINTQKFEVDAWGGGKVITDDMWYVYQQWFERYIRFMGDKPLYIDATEGGALIKGSKCMTFREAIDRFCLNEAEGFIEAKLSEKFLGQKLLTKAELLSFVEILCNVKKDLNKVESILTNGIELSEKLRKEYAYNREPKPKDVTRILDGFKEVDDELNRISDSSAILNLVFQKHVYDLIIDRSEDMNEGTYIALKSKVLYDALKQSIEKTLPLVDEAINDLRKIYDNRAS